MRAAVVVMLLTGCATGGADDGATTIDASTDSAAETSADTEPVGKPACDPAADPCPPDQHCSPLLRQCIMGCRANEGCASGKCDVANHECVQCLGNADCKAGEVCSGNTCVPGCSADSTCPSGLTCCSGGCVDTALNVGHCGGCGNKCSVSNGSAACSGGKCAIASCKTPWESCDGNAANGCETDTTASKDHCGGCGKPCSPKNASATCALGVCKIGSCTSGFGDCNGSAADGCEANLATDPNNCGSCGNKPTEACNLRDDNCNGACDDVDGCRTGIHRSFGSEYFYTNSSVEAACCGFTVQKLNYFYLYNDAGADRVPFYRCYNPTVGRHFYTPSSTCEIWGADKVESVIGQIGTKEVCGSVPLYRLWSATYGHLFTIDAAERDAKIGEGWKDEGTTGYVWTSPRG